MISANNVTYRVGKKALFEDVNIKFTEGNCYGLIGANGAGKSTFLKILSGALDTTNGDIVITPGQRLSVLEQDHFKYDDCVVMDTVITHYINDCFRIILLNSSRELKLFISIEHTGAVQFDKCSGKSFFFYHAIS